MFHLFHNSYLDYDFRFISNYKSMIASDSCLEDPLYYEVVGDVPKMLFKEVSFEELIEKRFHGNKDSFWSLLLAPGTNEEYVCYVKPIDLCKLQIEYWKGIFESIDFEQTYYLYKNFTDDFRIKSLSNAFKVHRNDLEHLKVLTEEEFRILFDETQVSSFFNDIEKLEVNLEYYLLEDLGLKLKKTRYSLDIKLEKLCQEFLKQEVLQLKHEILINPAKFLGLIESDLSNFFDSPFEKLKVAPEFNWLADEQIELNSGDYIVKNYSIEIFLNLLNLLKKSESSLYSVDTDLHVKYFNHIYNDEFEELVQSDFSSFDKNFLFGGKLNFSNNFLLISHSFNINKNTQNLKCS